MDSFHSAPSCAALLFSTGIYLCLLPLWFTDWGLTGVWLAMFCDFVMQGVLAASREGGGKWKSIKV